MAKRKSKKINWFSIFAVSVLCAAVVLITLADYMGEDYKIPSWKEIYEYLELSDKPSSNQKVSVHIIDIGQGDSILIKADDKNVLIDAGENDKGDEVVAYLKSQNVKKLDYVIGTHPHSDHIGGLDYVINNMDVETVILPKIPDEIVPTTKTYLDLLTAISEKGKKIKPAKAGETIKLTDEIKLEILGPVADFEDLNNMSVVCKLVFNNSSFLFTGDAEKEAEKAILNKKYNLKADVLKSGHHGSSTSSTEAFLQAVDPKYVAISVGEGNKYKHPNKTVLDLYNKRKVKINRTDLDSTIVYESDGNSINVITKKAS